MKWFHRILVAFFCMILWQGCFKFRTSDPDAIKSFEEKSIPLQIKNFDYGQNRRIHYFETGNTEAPTIYFIHGTPGSADNYFKYLSDSVLGNVYRLISVDRPGFGNSNFGHAQPIQVQVDAFIKLIETKQNGKPVILVGHSLGGPIAAGMAAQDPHSIGTIIILAGSVSPELEPEEKWRKPLGQTFFRWFVPGAMRPSNDEMIDFKNYVMDMPEILGAVSGEVYLVHGTKDMLVPFGNMEYAVNHLSHASSVKTITFDGENHFIPWTRFKELKELLLYIQPQLK